MVNLYHASLMLLYYGRFSKDGDSKAGDVYSFGVVLLELLTGKQPIDPTLPEGMNLVSWAKPHLSSEGSIQTVVELGEDYPLVAVKMVIKSHKFQKQLCLFYCIDS